MSDNPQRKPFVAAAGRALNNPVEANFARVKKATPPYQKDVAYLDVVAAVTNIPGTSNQLRTKGPALWVLDGFETQGATSFDFGHIPIWCQMESAGADERSQLLQIGPYIFLPEAGTYFLRGYLSETPILGTIVSSAAKFYTSVYEGINLAQAMAFLTARRSPRMGMQRNNIALAAATVTAVTRPLDDVSKIPATGSLSANGMALHAYKVTICNEGANPVYVSVNNRTGLATPHGILLAVGATQSFEIPPVSTVYAYSVLGSTVSAYWEYL